MVLFDQDLSGGIVKKQHNSANFCYQRKLFCRRINFKVGDIVLIFMTICVKPTE